MDIFWDEESASREAMRAYLQPMFTGTGSEEADSLEALRAQMQPVFTGAPHEVELEPWQSTSQSDSKAFFKSDSKADAKTEVREYLARTDFLLRYCDQLERRLQAGWLKDENEALEAQVLQMQEDFLALQEDFRCMKEYLGHRIAELGHELDKQTASVEGSERRSICLEDRVRFHDEQQGLITNYWQVQCDKKDESIKFFNRKLTEYTVDSQYLGVVEKRTEASISHEFQCLQDRHEKLQNEFDRRKNQQELLSERRKATEQAIEDCKARVPWAQDSKSSTCSPLAYLDKMEAEHSALLWRLMTLRGVKASMEAVEEEEAEEEEEQPADKPSSESWPHVCIWRDELEVRAQQLEKITSQLGATNHSLHLTNGELGRQSQSAEALRQQYDQALAELHTAETQTEAWRLQCAQSERTAEELHSLVSRKLGAVPSLWDHKSMPLHQRIAEIRQETQLLVEAKQKAGKKDSSKSSGD